MQEKSFENKRKGSLLNRNFHKIIIPFVFGCLLIIHNLTRYKIDSYTIVIVVLGLTPFFSVLIENLEIGGAKIKFFKNEQEEQRLLLNKIKFLILGFVTVYEQKHLYKLQQESVWMIRKEPSFQKFKRELDRLRDLNLISNYEGKGLRAMEKDIESGEINVKNYFKITDKGREYLNICNEQ